MARVSGICMSSPLLLLVLHRLHVDIARHLPSKPRHASSQRRTRGLMRGLRVA